MSGFSSSGGDVRQWNSTAVATPDTAGYPKVTVKAGTGTGELSLSSGLVSIVSTSIGQIKSIQRGTISLTGATTSATATLSPSVDTAKTELRYCGVTASLSDYNAKIVLTDGSTITATKIDNSASNGSVVVSWEITERY